MNCDYTLILNGEEKGTFGFSGLISKIKELVNFDDIKDTLYSLDSGKAYVTSALKQASKDIVPVVSSNNRDSDVEYGNKYISPQELVNDNLWQVEGVLQHVRKSDEDYINNKADAISKVSGVSLEEAKEMAQNEVRNWRTINKDGYDLHKLINSYHWGTSSDSEGKWIQHLSGTKFADSASQLYKFIKDDASRLMFGSFKYSPDSQVNILRNITLTAKIPGFEKEVVAHYDNIVIDDKGHLHIFNYKYSASSLHEWGRNKIETYKHEMAVKKQVLAANGFDVSQCTLHLLPIQVDYTKDFTGINSITGYTNSVVTDLELTMKNGNYVFGSYDKVARTVIPSKEIEMKDSPEKVEKINGIVSVVMDPERQLGINGVSFSVDEWISVNYNSKVQDRIKKVDDGYAVYIDDDYKNPHIIHDTTEPKNNEELKEYIRDHLIDLISKNDKAVVSIYESVVRAHKMKRGYVAGTNLGNIEGKLNTLLSKYLRTYEKDGQKICDWELIQNDTLASAGLLCFKNKVSHQLDVVCISTRSLRAIIKNKNQENIMAHYVKDIDSGKLINFKNSEENIQCLRACLILNELIDDMPDGNDIKLGSIKVFSRIHGGEVSVNPADKIITELLPEVIKVTKKRNADFTYENRLNKKRCVDPVTVLYTDYSSLVNSNSLSEDVQKLLQGLHIEQLESEPNKEAKRQILIDILSKLENIIKTRIYPRATPEWVINCANGNGTPQQKSICQLYSAVQAALCSLSNHYIANEYKLSWVQRYLPTQNAIANPTFRGCVQIFIRTVDSIADTVAQELSTEHDNRKPFLQLIREFYDKAGVTFVDRNVVGDQVKKFDNLYRRNSDNQIIMEFKNPYKDDFENRLNSYERQFLKEMLFRINKIRCLKHGVEFNYTSPDDPAFINFIEENPASLNVPLKKARDATRRSKTSVANQLKRKASNGTKFLKSLLSGNEREIITENGDDLYDWSLTGTFTETDSYADVTNRNRILNQNPQDYWETDLESLFIDYVEDYIKTKELNKALIEIKAILAHLELIGGYTGKKDGLKQTIDMIHDFVKANFFEKSLLEPQSEKLIAQWVKPFQHLVSRAYIAGNIVSAIRDTTEGLLQNYVRCINKFNSDISASNMTGAYKEVILNMWHDAYSINKLDQLSRFYRLSNSDIAKIGDQVKSGRSGIKNYENWMYATLRRPDFLNRMVLFVARCMQDGTWDAISINEKTGEIKYDWKKDKRFKAYAENSSNRQEYEKAKEAYYNAIQQYNDENDTHITPKDGLRMPYTYREIQSIRELANNIYGSYDKAMRSGYEKLGVGIFFGSFTTWMNGIYNNYFREKGIYDEYSTKTGQEHDVNGDEVYLYEDENGDLKRVIKHVAEDGSEQFTYEDTDKVFEGDPEQLSRSKQYIPEVVLGIFGTLKEVRQAFKEGKFRQDIWAHPKHRKNLDKLLSDLLGLLLIAALFKLALDPAYKDFSKNKKDINPVAAGLAFVMYNAVSRSYDGFMGPVNVLTHIGNNSNPPFYQLPAKIVDDLGNFVFGNRTWDSVIVGNIAIAKILQEPIKVVRAQNS